MRTFWFILFTFALGLSLAGCRPSPYYQKAEVIPQNTWAYNFRPTFKIDITDTTAAYLPFFIIRHTQAYPYSNIWVILHIKKPGDTATKDQRINITLAEASGKWLGLGMGEIYEQRMPISLGDTFRFNKPGTYQISMEQNMRINPLPEVLNIGLRLEQMKPVKQ